jgi:hypothetical protein
MLVEHGLLAVEDERLRAQLGDRAGDVGEAGRVIAAGAADQANVSPVLVGDDAPAVDLFFVSPAGTVKWGDEGRDGGSDLGERRIHNEGFVTRGSGACSLRQAGRIRKAAKTLQYAPRICQKMFVMLNSNQFSLREVADEDTCSILIRDLHN